MCLFVLIRSCYLAWLRLESALTDLGMQLDLRLQRSLLRLRITERCDGMLACCMDRYGWMVPLAPPFAIFHVSSEMSE